MDVLLSVLTVSVSNTAIMNVVRTNNLDITYSDLRAHFTSKLMPVGVPILWSCRSRICAVWHETDLPVSSFSHRHPLCYNPVHTHYNCSNLQLIYSITMTSHIYMHGRVSSTWSTRFIPAEPRPCTLQRNV